MSKVCLVEFDEKHEKGEVIELETKYGKMMEYEVCNLVAVKNGKYLHTIARIEKQRYAQRKINAE